MTGCCGCGRTPRWPGWRVSGSGSSSPPASPVPKDRPPSWSSPGCNQEISEFEVELAGTDGLLYDDWTMRRPEGANFFGRTPGFRFLRAKGNSIEGGTSEILRNIIAERVLGLPKEARVDTGPWKDLPR